jgi:hypothetical protein
MFRTVLAALAMAATLSATHAQQSPRSPDVQATSVEPMDAAHRHCSGSCLKTGALQWFCRPDQTCWLDCRTAPPRMHCHDPRP